MIRNIGLFLLAIFMTFVFLLSGIIINLLQALLYVALYSWNRSLYRKLNYYLIYTTWTQILAMCEWWSNTRCSLWGDEEALRLFGKEHCMIVMNHKYDMDWLMCWFICDKLGMLGNAKTLAKKSLKHIPVIGWGWVFAEMIFLERNWEKDKEILRKGLSSLVEYEDPIMILYFCEGTRFTPEKHLASIEFAKSRNLPELKHHLCPRPSGFNFAATHLKDKIAAVYDVQLGFPATTIKPTFSNMLRGHGFNGDIHIRRIPMSEIPTDSNEATSAWLHHLYQEKDQLMDDYLKTNRFPGRCLYLKRSYRSLINSIFWVMVVGVPFLYLIFWLLTMGNFWVTSITVSIIVLLFSSMYIMVRATKASKGSSYGKDKSPSKTSNGSGIHDSALLETRDFQNDCKGDVTERVISNINHTADGQEQVISNRNCKDVTEPVICLHVQTEVITKEHQEDLKHQVMNDNHNANVSEQIVNKEGHGDLQRQVISGNQYEDVSEQVVNKEGRDDLQQQVINKENQGDFQEQIISKEHHDDLQYKIISGKNHSAVLREQVINEEIHEGGEVISEKNLKDGTQEQATNEGSETL